MDSKEFAPDSVPSSIQMFLEAEKRAKEQLRQLQWAETFRKQMTQVWEPYRKQQEALQRQFAEAMKPSQLVQQYVVEIAKANAKLINQSFFEAASKQASYFNNLKMFHESWGKIAEERESALKNIFSTNFKFNIQAESLFLKSYTANILKS